MFQNVVEVGFELPCTHFLRGLTQVSQTEQAVPALVEEHGSSALEPFKLLQHCPAALGQPFEKLEPEFVELTLDIKRVADVFFVELALHFVEEVLNGDGVAVLVLLVLTQAAHE